MSLYDTYAHLLGLPYESGRQDCYGLLRRYYKEQFSIDLLNFARPDGWWDEPDLNILSDFLDADGWQDVGCNSRLMRRGDALVFSLLNSKVNHVGIYVGNGMFIHHLWNNFSREEAVTPKWTSRLLHVVRLPAVEEAISQAQGKLDYTNLLPTHVKRKIAPLS